MCKGISTRSVEAGEGLEVSGIPKGEISRLCVEVDECVNAFMTRPHRVRLAVSVDRCHLRERTLLLEQSGEWMLQPSQDAS
jgi:hypothetical protein